MSWYVVLTKPRQELRAQEHLQQQGGEVFLPMLSVEKIQRGRRVVAQEPLFPSYLFLSLDDNDPLLSKVRSTLGVRQLLMFANKAVTVDERLLTDIRSRVEGKDNVQLFDIGQQVVFNEGPFRNYQAVFKNYVGEERAIVLLNLLGQQNELVVQLEELRQAT